MEICIIVLFCLCLVLNIIGIIGSVVPGIPGPPLSMLGMLCCMAADLCMPFAWRTVPMVIFTMMMLVMVVFVTVLDFMAPGLMAKIGGGGKWANRGANIGLIAGIIYGGWWLVIGPFVGGFLGALSDLKAYSGGQKVGRAFKSAAFTLIALVAGTMFKLLVSIIIFIICIVDFWLCCINLN